VDLFARPRVLVIGLSLLLAASLGFLPTAPGNADQAATAVHAQGKRAIWRPNGTVDVLLRTHKHLYMGGDFTGMVSPGGHETVRRVRLAAVSPSSGQIMRKFRARANGTVRTMAVFGHHLYIGGDFTRVNHRSRLHLAALNLRNGRLVRPWETQVDGPVLALLHMGSRLYVGGNFGSVGEFPRDKLFALTKDAELVAGWPALDTGTNGGAYVLAATPDRTAVIVGGAFRNLVGQPRTFLGSITTDGQTTSWAPTPACTTNCFVRSLVVGATRVFAGIAGPGGHVKAYRLSDAAKIWSVGTSGDVTAMARIGKRLLLGGHFKFVSHLRHVMFAELRARNGAVLDRRVSTSGHRYPGVLTMNVFGGVALLGGAFEDIANQRHLAVISP
jgi:hypothetical protein